MEAASEFNLSTLSRFQHNGGNVLLRVLCFGVVGIVTATVILHLLLIGYQPIELVAIVGILFLDGFLLFLAVVFAAPGPLVARVGTHGFSLTYPSGRSRSFSLDQAGFHVTLIERTITPDRRAPPIIPDATHFVKLGVERIGLTPEAYSAVRSLAERAGLHRTVQVTNPYPGLTERISSYRHPRT
jgi:hypothetical protein